MNLYEDGHLDLFRLGVLPNMLSLVQIGHCMFKLVQIKLFPVASRWRSDYNGIFIFRCVQAWILIERVKSGADRTLYG